jgi:hypothetical protein
MKIFRFVAAVAAACSFAGLAGAAFAQTEWHTAPHYGPRAPLKAPERVQVAATLAFADCCPPAKAG